MRAGLVEPARCAGVRVAGEDSRSPFVITRPLLGIPGRRIRGPVIDEIKFFVVRDESPNGTSANAPCLRWPARHAEVFSLVLGIERLELLTNQNFVIGSCAVCPPDDFAGLRIQGRQPAAHTIFAAAV